MKYKNKKGGSGVSEYLIGNDSIIVKFRNGKFHYLYNGLKPGKHHVDNMIQLAQEGEGLNRYIKLHVRKKFYSKY